MHWSARLATLLTIHEAVYAGRWRQANARLRRSEALLAAIVLLLLDGAARSWLAARGVG